MSLIIDDPEVKQLAEAIAEATGVSVERVVASALRERYAALPPRGPRASLAELRALAKSISAEIKRPLEDHGTLLYDEHGLPK
jgi:antitoxin VapB